MKYMKTSKREMTTKNQKQILQNKWNSQDNSLTMKDKLKQERLNRLDIKSSLKFN